MLSVFDEESLTSQTKNFAFSVLLFSDSLFQTCDEKIVIDNLVYSSLVLHYNMFVLKYNIMQSKKFIEVLESKLIGMDTQIINQMIIDLLTLFSRRHDSAEMILMKPLIVKYMFKHLLS